MRGCLESLLNPCSKTSLEHSSDFSVLSGVDRSCSFCALNSEVNVGVRSSSSGPGASNGTLSLGGSRELRTVAGETGDSEGGILFRASGSGGNGEGCGLRNGSTINCLNGNGVGSSRLEVGDHDKGFTVSEVVDPFLSTDNASDGNNVVGGGNTTGSCPTNTNLFSTSTTTSGDLEN